MKSRMAAAVAAVGGMLAALILVTAAPASAHHYSPCPPRHVEVKHTHYVWKFSLQVLDVVVHRHCVPIRYVW